MAPSEQQVEISLLSHLERIVIRGFLLRRKRRLRGKYAERKSDENRGPAV